MRKKIVSLCENYTGSVFRGHDPRWSFEPLSGFGAQLNGGRFNPVGTAAFYSAKTQAGAWVEAQQGFQFKAQPLLMCQYQVECEAVLDLTQESILNELSITPDTLSCAWLGLSAMNKMPLSWALANRLIDAGVAAIVVPSFAIEATAEMKNIVFWKWRKKPHLVSVIDDFNRLPKNDKSFI